MTKRIKDGTDRMRAFAVAFVENGGNKSDAAIAAGYSPKGANVRGHKLFKDERVKKIIDELSKERLRGCTPKAIAVMTQLLDADNDKIKYSAAETILGLNGYIKAQKIEFEDKTDRRSDEEIREESIRMAKELGLPIATHDAPENPQ